MVQDDKYKSSKGYNHGEFGDSGSPLWKETYPEGTNTLDSSEKRHTVVAVYSTGAGLGMVGLMGKQDKCVDLATKVTPDIIAWIKRANEENPAEVVHSDTSP